MAQGRKQKAKSGRGKLGRSDRWPSDYGRRQTEDKTAQAKKKAKGENVDEQGDRANVRQNTPPKGLRGKR